MLKISRLADYAVVVMSGLGREPGIYKAASVLADDVGLPEPTVSKVLKLLAGKGLLESVRGSQGGYRLARPCNAVTVAEIIAAVDGPIKLTDCADGEKHECGLSGHCSMTGRWKAVNGAIRAALEGVTLADMMASSVRPARARTTQESVKGQT